MNSDDPSSADIYNIGTVAKIKQITKLPNGTQRVLVEGFYRAEVIRYLEEEENFIVEAEEKEEIVGDSYETEALMRTLLEQFQQYIKVSRKLTDETFETVGDIIIRAA